MRPHAAAAAAAAQRTNTNSNTCRAVLMLHLPGVHVVMMMRTTASYDAAWACRQHTRRIDGHCRKGMRPISVLVSHLRSAFTPPFFYTTRPNPVQGLTRCRETNAPRCREILPLRPVAPRALRAAGACVACCVSPLHPWTPRLVAAPDHVFALPTSFKVISHPSGTLPRPVQAGGSTGAEG